MADADKNAATAKPKTKLVEIEEKTLTFWNEKKIFQKSLDKKSGAAGGAGRATLREFVFTTALLLLTACRTMATCWRHSSKTSFRDTKPCRASTSRAAGAGIVTAYP